MTDFDTLFRNSVPLIDVRAPVEFEEGHFPESANFPLMNNDERKQVGTEYKRTGQASALELGHRLVRGELKEERVAAWTKFIDAHPEAKLYCFRGGLRSEISLSWIGEAGRSIEMVPGGYKALRHYLIETLADQVAARSLLLLAGRTGSGKTEVLQKSSSPFLDLEKNAHHKGSSFGGLGPQPTQVTFENRLAVDLLKLPLKPPLLIEDEAVMIGSVVVPKILFEKMRVSPLLVLERDMETRIATIAKDYVMEKTKYFLGDMNQTHLFMVQALARIQTKLGGMNHALILKQMNAAFLSANVQDLEIHEAWIRSLLVHYYDPLYDRSLKRSADRIAFQGNESECLHYLQSLSQV